MSPSNRTEPDRQADRALVERCLGHEPGAFDELYRRFAPRVFTLACRMTGSRSSGEDLLQEIFLLVYRKLGSFKGEAALGTWVYRLATNCCLDYPAQPAAQAGDGQRRRSTRACRRARLACD